MEYHENPGQNEQSSSARQAIVSDHVSLDRIEHAHTQGVELAKRSLAIIKSWEEHGGGGSLLRLRSQAIQLSEFELSQSRTVAVVGDTGQGMEIIQKFRTGVLIDMATGKSSLINSLLGCDGIAPTVS